MKSTWKRKRYKSRFKKKKWKIKKHTEEKQGEDRRERERENKQSLRRMTHGWDDAHQHLSQCGVSHIIKRSRCEGERVTCEVYCLQFPCPSVGGAVYATRPLQQNAISCKRTHYNKLKK